MHQHVFHFLRSRGSRGYTEGCQTCEEYICCCFALIIQNLLGKDMTCRCMSLTCSCSKPQQIESESFTTTNRPLTQPDCKQQHVKPMTTGKPKHFKKKGRFGKWVPANSLKAPSSLKDLPLAPLRNALTESQQALLGLGQVAARCDVFPGSQATGV